jgi:cyclopropane-fatty-acyl-phospholipid synthase
MGAIEPLGIPGTHSARSTHDSFHVRRSHRRRSTPFDRMLLHVMARALHDPDIALGLWDGETLAPRSGRAPACVRFADRGALWPVMLNPMMHFGDMYSAGRIEVEGDLVAGLEAVYRAFRKAGGNGRLLNGLFPNSPGRARHNIHHHYDIGNDFYALWLDREMQYTCAYYPRPDMSLEQAQTAKLHHICRKLRLRPGERVVEAGCGWGGLARFMARHYGVTVRAYNISHEQIVFARERMAAEEGLEDRIEYIEDDYRNIDGSFDAFVSIGMLEHVGKAHHAVLGEVVDRCLTDRGRGLIHTMGRNRTNPVNPWIRKRIFPGSYVPTLREIAGIFEPAGLSVIDVENLRLHYAETLRDWLVRFEYNHDAVRSMFDERFARAWRLYLCGSIASFKTGSLQLFQLVFARPDNNELPRSRAYLYEASASDPEAWESTTF